MKAHRLDCGIYGSRDAKRPCDCGRSGPHPQDALEAAKRTSKAEIPAAPRVGAFSPYVEPDPLFTAVLLAEADALVQAWKRDPGKMQGWVLDRMMRNLVLQDHLVTRTIPGRSGPIIQAKAFDRFGEMAEAVLSASAPPEAPKRKGKKKTEEGEDE